MQIGGSKKEPSIIEWKVDFGNGFQYENTIRKKQRRTSTEATRGWTSPEGRAGRHDEKKMKPITRANGYHRESHFEDTATTWRQDS